MPKPDHVSRASQGKSWAGPRSLEPGGTLTRKPKRVGREEWPYPPSGWDRSCEVPESRGVGLSKSIKPSPGGTSEPEWFCKGGLHWESACTYLLPPGQELLPKLQRLLHGRGTLCLLKRWGQHNDPLLEGPPNRFLLHLFISNDPQLYGQCAQLLLLVPGCGSLPPWPWSPWAPAVCLYAPGRCWW